MYSIFFLLIILSQVGDVNVKKCLTRVGEIRYQKMIEANNIEYGNIEKWGGWLNRNHSDGNIEFNFENSNIDSKTGSNGVKMGS